MSAIAPILASLALGPASAGTNLQHVSAAHSLLVSAPSSCIAIEVPRSGLQIVLDKNELKKMAGGSPGLVAPEQRRMASIRAHRAARLLADTSSVRDELGCYVNSKLARFAKMHPPRDVDWVYVVFYIFGHGRGRVWDTTTKSFLKSYRYVTYGAHCGWCLVALESLRAPSGRIFLQAALFVR